MDDAAPVDGTELPAGPEHGEAGTNEVPDEARPVFPSRFDQEVAYLAAFSLRARHLWAFVNYIKGRYCRPVLAEEAIPDRLETGQARVPRFFGGKLLLDAMNRAWGRGDDEGASARDGCRMTKTRHPLLRTASHCMYLCALMKSCCHPAFDTQCS